MDDRAKTLGQIYKKLRKQNKHQYALLFSCLFLPVLLITAFSVMVNSRTVLDVLPEGGDSRQQMYMIFALAAAGCMFFVVYAAGLFFRYKSREAGVLLALGVSRKQVRARLQGEMLVITLGACTAGLLLGMPAARAVWQLFVQFVIDSEEMRFRVQGFVWIWGLFFSIFTVAALQIKSILFVKNASLMDILRTQQRNETVREIKSWFSWAGILLVIVGILLGIFKDGFFLNVLHIYPPAWTALVFLLIPVGLYLFLLYSVCRGWRRKQYYRHLVSYSMMKFQGRQTVLNMCVIALLTAGAFFALFYTPAMGAGMVTDAQDSPYDFVYHFRRDQPMTSWEEVRGLAREEGVRIRDEKTIAIAVVARDGYYRDTEEGGKITTQYFSRYKEQKVISETEYNSVAGSTLHVERGTFVYVDTQEGQGTVWEDVQEDTSFLTNPVTGKELPVRDSGTSLVYRPFLGCFILNDSDYQEIAKGLPPQWMEEMRLFQVEDNKSSYKFAKKLCNSIIDRSTGEVEVYTSYDQVEKARCKGVYPYDRRENKPSYEKRESIDFTRYWKYYPQFTILETQDLLKNMSVFFMLFLFISLICFLAVLVIAYTRSLTIVMNNRQVYEDIRRLGGDSRYIRRTVKRQILRLFQIPVLFGAAVSYAITLFMLLGNSGIGLTKAEWTALGIDSGLVAASGALIYLVYRRTLRRVYRMVDER